MPIICPCFLVCFTLQMGQDPRNGLPLIHSDLSKLTAACPQQASPTGPGQVPFQPCDLFLFRTLLLRPHKLKCRKSRWHEFLAVPVKDLSLSRLELFGGLILSIVHSVLQHTRKTCHLHAKPVESRSNAACPSRCTPCSILERSPSDAR